MLNLKLFSYIKKNTYTDKDFIHLKFNKDVSFVLNKTFLQKIKQELSNSKQVHIDNEFDYNDLTHSSVSSTMAIEGEQYSDVIINKTKNISVETDLSEDLVKVISNNEKVFRITSGTLTLSDLKTLATVNANNFVTFSSIKNDYKINTTHDYLWKIYSFLTLNENLLDKESLKIKYKYRTSEVILFDSILKTKIRDGLNSSMIETYMNDFFKFIDKNLSDDQINTFELAWISHCIFEYIHPYNDFNGRTGRYYLKHMLLKDESIRHAYYFDELILNSKQKYYDFLNYSQDTKDLTFIVAYGYRLLVLLKQFLLIYSNIKEADIKLTNIQKRYLRFCSYKLKDFTLKDIVAFDKTSTKEKSILKMLNHFVDIDILEYKMSGKTKLFSVKEKWLK